MRETPEGSLSPSALWGHSQKMAFEPGSKSSPDPHICWHPDPGLQSADPWETQSLLFISPWSVAFLSESPQWMMTGVKGHNICSSLSMSSERRVFCLQNTGMEGRANDRAGRQTAWLSLGARFAGVFLLYFFLQLFCKPEWFSNKEDRKGN